MLAVMSLDEYMEVAAAIIRSGPQISKTKVCNTNVAVYAIYIST